MIRQKNELGNLVEKEIREIPNHYLGVKIDHYVVMPNHIHMILILEGERVSHPQIGQIISCYKAGVSRKIREVQPDMKVWQRSYYDHVIRNVRDYENIWNYIENNPIKWEEDRFYV